jgi:hypothetical protein
VSLDATHFYAELDMEMKASASARVDISVCRRDPSGDGGARLQPVSRTENLVLTAIACFQPITRGELSQLFRKEVSRDIIGQLWGLYSITAGPRSPRPDAPYT